MTTEEIWHQVAVGLRSRNPERRSEAESKLAALTQQEVYDLLEQFRQNYARQVGSNSLRGCSVFVVALLICFFVFLTGLAIAEGVYWESLIPAGIGAAFLPLARWYIRRIRPWTFTLEQEVVARVKDPLAVDPLLAYLFRLPSPADEFIAKALRRLLPKLSNEHRGMLHPYARASLNRIIAESNRFDTDFILTVLEALKSVGDESALKAPEELARGPIVSDRDRRIHVAALDTLAVIRRREEWLRQPETLLRPSTAAPEEVLLRPLESTPQRDYSRLWRPDSHVNLAQREGPEDADSA